MKGVKIAQKFSNFQEEKFQKLIENNNEIQFLKRDVLDLLKNFLLMVLNINFYY